MYVIFIFNTNDNNSFPVLSPYKYAGYSALLRTARLEAAADTLFSSEAALLPAACELAHATLACSALNAQELCRERGLEVLIGEGRRYTHMLPNRIKCSILKKQKKNF